MPQDVMFGCAGATMVKLQKFTFWKVKAELLSPNSFAGVADRLQPLEKPAFQYQRYFVFRKKPAEDPPS